MAQEKDKKRIKKDQGSKKDHQKKLIFKIFQENALLRMAYKKIKI